jgi:hypothetical protein
MPCTTDAINADFGAVSYDCQPGVGTNISGAGLKIPLSFTDATVSLPKGDDCDPPLAATHDCWCGVCSHDPTIVCNTDAFCAGLMGGSTCTSGGGAAAARAPNDCADLTCEDVGGERGECTGVNPADTELYCDGFVRQGGGGIISCTNNGDCTASDPACPGSDCGNCTVAQVKRCFLEDASGIQATGNPGTDGAELSSLFCFAATGAVGLNIATGAPGPGRVVLDFDFTEFCADGTTEYQFSGANCP